MHLFPQLRFCAFPFPSKSHSASRHQWSTRHVGWVFRLLNGQKPVLDAKLAKRLGTPPDVPTIAIYSRSDGIVAWQDCVQPKRKHLRSVEVEGSHVGMGWNPRVLSVIGQTLRTEQ